jgi:L-asparaginase
MMSEIEKAIAAGIKLVVTTSAEEGSVYTTYDYEGSAFDLFKKGVILGSDNDSKKPELNWLLPLQAI